MLPALTAGIQNQGLNNYVPKEGTTVLKNVISISANGANTGVTFYQPHEFTILQDAYAIQWIYSTQVLSPNVHLFITSAISSVIYGKYEWTNKAGWRRVCEEYIQLPTREGEIDFEFMERFIAELNAYLSITGLKDYTLTPEEEQAVKDFEEGKDEWGEFNVTKVFEVRNAGNILASEIMEGSGEIPYLCASRENNAVSSYISYRDELITKGNCIFIGGKTFVVTYQERDFFSNDSHNLTLRLYASEHQTRSKQLYLATCVNKSLRHKYSWGDSVSNRKIQRDKIYLPSINEEVDFSKMETLISAIQKLVIKDVVLYADREIVATKRVIDKTSKSNPI